MQPEEQAPRQEMFHVGQNLDVLDSVRKWTNGQVRFVGNNTLYIHYTGWSVKYDESIPVASQRVMTQWQPGKTIKLNNRIDVYHPHGGWLEARVIDIDHEQISKVKVHFFNFHQKYDMWVSTTDNNAVAIIGSRSKAYGMGKNRKKNNKKLSQLLEKILEEKTKKLEQSLREADLTIKPMGEDGNCLFRSVSDQLYGTQEHHAQIRKSCMDYISYERAFFQDYVLEDIDQYLGIKRMDGEWGDDVQIQALSEIYNRPIEIYVFDNKPIKTFHESNNNAAIQPLRLNYIGSCHYNSIKKLGETDKGLMEQPFGRYEEMFFMTYNHQHQQFMESNMRVRNREFFSNCNRIEDTIQEQIQAEDRHDVKMESELDRILEISETEALLSQIQTAELREVQNRCEQDKIAEELKKLEERELEEAKKLSYHPQHTLPRQLQKPYWFDQLVCQGFSDEEIWFAIDAKGYDPDAVQNFLLDNF